MTSVRQRESGADGNGDSSSYSSCAANIIKLFSSLRAKFTKWSIRSSNSSKVMSSSNKSSSSATPAVLVRSRSSACADPIVNDSHRAQAIEDCIEFLNSSSSSSHSHSHLHSQSQSQSL